MLNEKSKYLCAKCGGRFNEDELDPEAATPTCPKCQEPLACVEAAPVAEGRGLVPPTRRA